MALGSLRERAAFQQLLATRPMARSAHFAVHCLPLQAVASGAPPARTGRGELCTGEAPILSPPVDNSAQQHLLGCVLPKRLARRAVSRNLLRREIRSAMRMRAERLIPGQWLVRLRAPWPVAQWHSAASKPLRLAVRAELAALVDACVAASEALLRARTNGLDR